MRKAACSAASWRENLPFDVGIRCLNFSHWCSGTQLKVREQSIYCGYVGAVVCEGWDEVVEVVVVDCLDVDTRVTVAGVVLFFGGLAACSEGCRL